MLNYWHFGRVKLQVFYQLADGLFAVFGLDVDVDTANTLDGADTLHLEQDFLFEALAQVLILDRVFVGGWGTVLIEFIDFEVVAVVCLVVD